MIEKMIPMKKIPLPLIVSSLLIALAGCQSVPSQPTDFKEGLSEAIEDTKAVNAPKPLTQVPNSVQQEVMQQSMSKAKQGLLSEKRLQVAATAVEAKDFFNAIVEGSAYSIAIHPDVSGQISLNLTDVTLSETLNVIEEIYGYEIHQSNNIIKVYPSGMRSETIALNYLFLKRFGTSSTSINSGGVSENDPNSGGNSNNNNNSSGNGSNNNRNSNNNNSNSQTSSSGINIYTENESDFWLELKETLTAFVGTEGGRSVIVSPQAGLVTVRGMPDEISAVKKFITDTETHLHRQVIIEAKIMEVTLNDDYQQGVHWEEVLGSLGDTNFTFQTNGNISGNVISSAIGGATSLSFSGPDFSGVIDLLQTQGNVQVLSSPRITATNNQKAVIKVGEDEYFVTEVSSTTTTGTATTTTPEVTLTPFFSGIALDVTPQIDKDGDVVLHVHPSVTLTDEQNKSIQLGSEELILPLAQSSVRESDTIIRAKSGEIVVIGGLIETYTIDKESKTPLLGDIPIVGELFKSKSETTQKRELVILLKPVVVGADTWQNQLQDARQLLDQWFPEESHFNDDSNNNQE
ncbi:pilus (MSHA type) biogenesis protein MshL [Litorilituus lipolyticus]|uniref:Pilus (MSHA type) biogenesis protein MshL n=1 Tax=Litorilituus lipolyticus TaxID=2491017 RepID=A0A502L284_9GAMM|nr:pilus (MSHA type) biogenesis protein MshL [Litorilituus lipolyticus]TPH17806.1 pilus (MSHA type) biogenesis protein MshL [Litorilituus lipolyticus]